MSEKPYRILIIEDSPEDRAFYRRRLAQGHEQDFTFWETGSGEEGLRLCGQVMPDCVLLDYQLPDLDGLEFLDRFPAAVGGAPVPVVMLTGHGNEAVAVQAMKKGIHDYLVKGLNHEGLRQVVQAAIDKGALRRQLDEHRKELERLSAERLSLIAELKQQAAALSEANQRKDDFLAMLAHELRNPLAPLRTMFQVMRLRGVQDPDVVKAHEMMERQVIHLARLVDDLLDVSRITRGLIELRKEAVDVSALAQRVVETNRAYLESRHHQLTVELPCETIRVEADPARLTQVVGNLLNNAAKYTPQRGRVTLAVVREADEVVIRVRDTGAGIPVEMLEKVFDPFTQVDRTLDRSEGGLGIGLTLVKRIVDLHGGCVRAFSAGPGKGSEFVVRLPALADPLSESSAAEGTPGAAEPRRILVVDDNVDAAESLAMLLRLSGHEVRILHEGSRVVEVVLAFRLEVVLLDIGLPGLNGYEVARRLRAERGLNGLLLVAMTGYGQEEDRRRTHEAGFDHHFVKPADPVALEKVLQSSAG